MSHDAPWYCGRVNGEGVGGRVILQDILLRRARFAARALMLVLSHVPDGEVASLRLDREVRELAAEVAKAGHFVLRT